MEYLYSVNTRLVHDEIYYFVNKIMTFPELKGAVDVLAGFGMNTDFDKACNICGIVDCTIRKQLLSDLTQHRFITAPDWLPVVQVTNTEINRKIHPVQITGIADHWLVNSREGVLN